MKEENLNVNHALTNREILENRTTNVLKQVELYINKKEKNEIGNISELYEKQQELVLKLESINNEIKNVKKEILVKRNIDFNTALLKKKEKEFENFEHQIKEIGENIKQKGSDRHKNAVSNFSIINDVTKTYEWSKVIRALDAEKDKKLGIEQIIIDKTVDGKKENTLIRDARDSVKKINTDEINKIPEIYLMHIFNTTRASEKIMEYEISKLGGNGKITYEDEEGKTQNINNLDDYRKYTKKLINKSIDFVRENPSQETMKYFDTKIYHKLNNIKINHGNQKIEKIHNIKDKIKFAKDICNLDDEHYNVVTLSKIDNQDIIEADIKLGALTQEQKNEYNAIAKGEKGPDWYSSLKDHEKFMIKNVAGSIANGEKIIPCQLWKSLAGIRNGYQKIVAIGENLDRNKFSSKDEHSRNKIKILSKSIHCAAPASNIKDHEQEICNENVKQLKSFVNPNQNIMFNVLNTESVFAQLSSPIINSDELEIHRQLRSLRDNKISLNFLPVNFFRKMPLTTFDTNKINKVLKDVGKEILTNHPEKKEFTKYLQKNEPGIFRRIYNSIENALFNTEKKRDEKINQEIKNLTNEDKLLYSKLYELKKLIMNGKSSKNLSVEISSMMTNMKSLSKRYKGIKANRQENSLQSVIPEVVTFCKSGKDRTGYVMTKAAIDAVHSEMKNNGSKITYEDVAEKLLEGGHTAEMSNIQGGSIGCYGIKAGKGFFGKDDEKIMSGKINFKYSKFNKLKIMKNKEYKNIDKQNEIFNKQDINKENIKINELNDKIEQKNIKIDELDDKIDREYVKINSLSASGAYVKINELGADEEFFVDPEDDVSTRDSDENNKKSFASHSKDIASSGNLSNDSTDDEYEELTRVNRDKAKTISNTDVSKFFDKSNIRAQKNSLIRNNKKINNKANFYEK